VIGSPACLTRSLVVLGLTTSVLGISATAAQAQFRHDSSLPIEITADSLEVLRDQRVATFTGNVDAVQGDLVLTADRLRIHYSGDDAGAAAGTGGSIRRIEAFGKVFITSPRETAQGEVGVYDVADETITLEGDVVLTRERNVIEGERLELDLATGRSRMLAGVPSDEGGQPPERVRAIFVPASPAGTGQDAPSQGDDRAASPQADVSAPSPAPPQPKLRPEG
jgi:lipopolysaccharide export system protein LptA